MEKNSDMRARMDKKIAQELESFARLSDQFAAHPEVGSEEYQTSAALVKIMQSHGFEVEHPYSGIETAFNAVKKNGSGPVVAFLAEYDALPEIGHACGHNMNGIISALGAVGLAEALGDFPGEVRLVGTPAEETNGAKVTMAECGVFDDVDLAVMFHVASGHSYVRYRCLAMQAFEFTFRGHPAHAASSPWSGVNALNGVQLFFHAIDMLRQHVRPEARMHGVIIQGGSVPNVVPDVAVARFYFRAPWKGYLNEMIEKALNCARGAALATGTQVEWFNNEFSFDNMLPNPSAETLMEGIMNELGIETLESANMDGSSDVGNVSWVCPALQPKLAVSSEKIAPHTREFAQMVSGGKKVRKTIEQGARSLARLGLEVISDLDVRRRLREDFELEKRKAADIR